MQFITMDLFLLLFAAFAAVVCQHFATQHAALTLAVQLPKKN